jgi:integrase
MELYLDKQLKGKSSYPYYQRLYRQLFLRWAELPLSDITRPMIRTLHGQLQPTPAHANKALALVKTAFRWAEHTEDNLGAAYWTGDNPGAGIRRHRTYSRIRVLTDWELSTLLTALDYLQPKYSAYLTVLLLTGCRMSEARHMRWEHLDLNQGRWVKPHTKNGLAQVMPLPRQAARALSALPRQGHYVFAGFYGHPWSRAGAEKTWGEIRRPLGLTDVWLHDFRRTVATRLYEQERDELLVKACLNHFDGRPLAVYVRLNFDLLSRALQAHADRLWTLKQLQAAAQVS